MADKIHSILYRSGDLTLISEVIFAEHGVYQFSQNEKIFGVNKQTVQPVAVVLRSVVILFRPHGYVLLEGFCGSAVRR